MKRHLVLPVFLMIFFGSGCATTTKAKKTQENAVPMEKESVSSKKEEKGELYSLSRVQFDFDSYTLREDARQTLKKNADILKNLNRDAELGGHCDERGSNEYNLALGEKRVLQVKKYLIELGVDSNKLSAVSFGEEMPLNRGHEEIAWAENRRVEFSVMTP